MNCYVCGEELRSENRSVEHIILNSIGGCLKSKDLICKKCNSSFGDKIDSVLSEQLSFISTMINIKRNRGKPQKVMLKNEKTGEPFFIGPGGKPEATKPVVKEIQDIENGTIQYNIIARNSNEAKEILKGLKKKHPQIDVDYIIQNAELRKEYIDDKLLYGASYGGVDAFRSICKTAVNYYIYCGGCSKFIVQLLPFIRSATENFEDIINFCYNDEIIAEKEQDQIVHLIALVGDPKNCVLYTYIEFFNAFKFIILLNDEYAGDEIESIYCYDIINNSEVKKEVKLNLSKIEIKEILNSTLPYEMIKTEYCKLMDIIMRKQKAEMFEGFADSSLERSLKKYPEGSIITEAMCKELTDEFMKEITPWILHNFSNKLDE